MYNADPDSIVDIDSEPMDERKPAAKSNSPPIEIMDSDSGFTPPPTRQFNHLINTNTTASSSLSSNVAAPVTKPLSARDKEAIRSNNARESLNIIKKYNSRRPTTTK